jgi:hypothetical protein
MRLANLVHFGGRDPRGRGPAVCRTAGDCSLRLRQLHRDERDRSQLAVPAGLGRDTSHIRSQRWNGQRGRHCCPRVFLDSQQYRGLDRVDVGKRGAGRRHDCVPHRGKHRAGSSAGLHQRIQPERPGRTGARALPVCGVPATDDRSGDRGRSRRRHPHRRRVRLDGVSVGLVGLDVADSGPRRRVRSRSNRAQRWAITGGGAVDRRSAVDSLAGAALRNASTCAPTCRTCAASASGASDTAASDTAASGANTRASGAVSAPAGAVCL